ncbi:GATOR complex protein wdr59 [Coemansia sp. RSA 2399]|nr:GATOR complex protein wdr59 [Coemansia sp. RSA 2399]KAJ1884022.1 GATOR complex protein wdr59 [Coemansia sp. IMI 209127]
MHNHCQRDDNEFAVSTLKLYDQGRILFGCGTNSILVWDTNGIKHKESLMILSDVDGVYDVGRDYVVANSTKGEMCVWKSGSRNYMWRYNDTRRFKAGPGSDANETPIITALQVDPDDMGAFVGDMSGYVSYGDFRSPLIHRLSPNLCAGVPRSFANASQHELLVGTDDGLLALFDTRYVHSKSAKISTVKKYVVPGASQINRIRVCPHDPNVFACSIGRNVYIYRNGEHRDAEKSIFCHQAHQTHVVDFDWHPSQQYKYTIGSTESGEGLDSGEIQIWEPSSVII